jgi:hypothetical protein
MAILMLAEAFFRANQGDSLEATEQPINTSTSTGNVLFSGVQSRT